MYVKTKEVIVKNQVMKALFFTFPKYIVFVKKIDRYFIYEVTIHTLPHLKCKGWFPCLQVTSPPIKNASG